MKNYKKGESHEKMFGSFKLAFGNGYGVSQKEQVVKIDEYLGYIEEKKNENDKYSFVAEEVIICTIPSVDGTNLEIVMDKSIPDSVNIFNEILKSIKFKK